jgi:hypothetical protein
MTEIKAATMSQKYRYFDNIDQARKLSSGFMDEFFRILGKSAGYDGC